jgi:polysaccharide biosynthesis protein PslG
MTVRQNGSWLTVLALLTLGVNAARAIEFPTTVTDGIGIVLDAAEPPYDFDLFQQAGGKIARLDLYWDQVETVKGQYNFLYNDGVLNMDLRPRGIHRLATLCYGNALYGTDHSSQTWRDGFTNFAAAVAAHYADDENIFEIWNEPNAGWTSSYLNDPSAYVAFVAQVATAMRAADPKCKLLAPSLSELSTTSISWLHSCIDQGLLNYVDAISVHPYRATSPETVVANYTTVRTLMKDHGKTLPLVCSEWGYSTGTSTGTAHVANAQLQADYLARIYLVNASQGVLLTTAFEWKDTGDDPNDFESNFGVVKTDRELKPAYDAMKLLTASLKGTTFTERLQVNRSMDWLLVFTSANGQKTLAAWTTGDAHTIQHATWGTLNLTSTPFYLNPVPEPGTLSLAICGAIGLCMFVFWKRK